MSASIQSATDLSLINFLYFGWTFGWIFPFLTSLILSFKNCSLPSKFDPSLILCQSEESIIWNKVTFDLWCSRGTRKPETRKENPTWTQFLVTILPKNPENRETEFLDFGTLQIVPEQESNSSFTRLYHYHWCFHFGRIFLNIIFIQIQIDSNKSKFSSNQFHERSVV